MKTNTNEWFKFQDSRGITPLSFTISDVQACVLKNNEVKSEEYFKNDGEFLDTISISVVIPLPSRKFNELNKFS